MMTIEPMTIEKLVQVIPEWNIRITVWFDINTKNVIHVVYEQIEPST